MWRCWVMSGCKVYVRLLCNTHEMYLWFTLIHSFGRRFWFLRIPDRSCCWWHKMHKSQQIRWVVTLATMFTVMVVITILNVVSRVLRVTNMHCLLYWTQSLYFTVMLSIIITVVLWPWRMWLSNSLAHKFTMKMNLVILLFRIYATIMILTTLLVIILL